MNLNEDFKRLKALGAEIEYMETELPIKKSEHKSLLSALTEKLKSSGIDVDALSKPKRVKVCKICNFATDPPHDARAHKHQAIPAAFTDTELEELKMRRVRGPAKDDLENENHAPSVENCIETRDSTPPPTLDGHSNDPSSTRSDPDHTNEKSPSG